jgi:hypothetical protein
LSDEELLEVRARHLAEPTEESYVRTVDGLRAWRQTIEDHQFYDELVLWFEHDLFDQLNLIQILTVIRPRIPAEKVSLVCIGSFPGHPRFKGLGELAPGDLASLLETRQRVTEAQYALAKKVWQAFRSPTPEALDDLRRTDTAALPYLAAAVTRFLQEYPWMADGLSRSERRLLHLAERGPIEVSAAFPRMHDDEEAYYITDSSLAALVETLSDIAPPLVAIDPGAAGSHGRLLYGTVTLTDAGRTVLAGQRDRVTMCGIDRWLGGVHLHSGTAIWRWDDEQQRMTKS